MGIYKIDRSNLDSAAKLMSAVKPDWWDFEGASRQLQDVTLLANLIGWYMGDNADPSGWILCAQSEIYYRFNRYVMPWQADSKLCR